MLSLVTMIACSLFLLLSFSSSSVDIIFFNSLFSEAAVFPSPWPFRPNQTTHPHTRRHIQSRRLFSPHHPTRPPRHIAPPCTTPIPSTHPSINHSSDASDEVEETDDPGTGTWATESGVLPSKGKSAGPCRMCARRRTPSTRRIPGLGIKRESVCVCVGGWMSK